MNPDYDIIIIGAGPAGITAGQYCARANLRTLIVEEMATGGALLLINDLENYPGFPETINGFEFSRRMQLQAKNFGAQIKTTSVNAIEKNENNFILRTNTEEITSWAVILATGTKHKLLNVPGEQKFTGYGVSYCATCDGPFFKNQRILVVGGGDAACDEAVYLANLTDTVTLIHRRNQFRAQKSLAERVLRNPHIDVRFNHVLEQIHGDQKVNQITLKRTDTGETYTEAIDAVFIFIGADPQTGLCPELEKDSAGYIITNPYLETAIAGLYIAGDVRSTPFRQIVVACGEGAIAAHQVSLYIDEIKGNTYMGISQS